jgi:hypothetical protein
MASMNDCLTITLAAEHITMAAAYMKAVLRLTLPSGEKYRISPPTNRGWMILHIKHQKCITFPWKHIFLTGLVSYEILCHSKEKSNMKELKQDFTNRPVKQDDMVMLYSEEAYFKSFRILHKYIHNRLEMQLSFCLSLFLTLSLSCYMFWQ